MPRNTLPISNGTSVEQIYVPNKFRNQYLKVYKKLEALRTDEESVPTKSGSLLNLEVEFGQLQKRLVDFAKNQKDHPIRHKAEMEYGKVNERGEFRGKKGRNRFERFLSGMQLIGAVASVGTLVAGTILSGGLLIIPLALTLATVAVATASVVISEKDIASRKKLEGQIKREDVNFHEITAAAQQNNSNLNIEDLDRAPERAVARSHSQANRPERNRTQRPSLRA